MQGCSILLPGSVERSLLCSTRRASDRLFRRSSPFTTVFSPSSRTPEVTLECPQAQMLCSELVIPQQGECVPSSIRARPFSSPSWFLTSFTFFLSFADAPLQERKEITFVRQLDSSRRREFYIGSFSSSFHRTSCFDRSLTFLLTFSFLLWWLSHILVITIVFS